MKKRDLERHLTAHGCQLVREGANHEMWENPVTAERSVVPRHREKGTHRPRDLQTAICPAPARALTHGPRLPDRRHLGSLPTSPALGLGRVKGGVRLPATPTGLGAPRAWERRLLGPS